MGVLPESGRPCAAAGLALLLALGCAAPAPEGTPSPPARTASPSPGWVSPAGGPSQERQAPAPPGGTASPAAPPMVSGRASPPAGGSARVELPQELVVLDALILHLRQGIQLAQEVQGRRGTPGLRGVGRALAQERRLHLGQLESWRQEWYPGTPRLTPEDLMRVVGLLGTMPRPPIEPLEPAHDRFMTEMALLLEEGIGFTAEVERRSVHPELRAKAAELRGVWHGELEGLRQRVRRARPAVTEEGSPPAR